MIAENKDEGRSLLGGQRGKKRMGASEERLEKEASFFEGSHLRRGGAGPEMGVKPVPEENDFLKRGGVFWEGSEFFGEELVESGNVLMDIWDDEAPWCRSCEAEPFDVIGFKGGSGIRIFHRG